MKIIYTKILLSLLLLFNCPVALADELSVTVDRNPVSIDETFQIIISLDGDTDLEPDFSPLEKQFMILRKQRSNNMSIINGDVSRENKWTVIAMAKKIGEQIIPEIKLGKLTSKPLLIEVKAGGALGSGKEDIFIDVELSSNEVYVQQQLVYTIKLYRSVATGNASLSEPDYEGADSLVTKLGEDSKYRTELNGVSFDVYERKYAVFPQQAGELKFNPIIFQGQLGSRARFFADPFGPAPRTVVKRSEALSLKVKPVPAEFKNRNWLPANELQLSESWSDSAAEFQVGEPVTRTITIKAKGLTAAQLPELDLKLPEQLKAYPDKPVLQDEVQTSGLVGIRQEKIAIIPTEAGEIELPEVVINYWSPEQEEMQQASLAKRIVKVLPVSNAEQLPDQNIDMKTKAVTENKNAIVETEKLSDKTIFSSEPLVEESSLSLWMYLSVFFAIAWLITLFLLWKNTQQKKTEEIRSESNKESELISAIKRSSQNNDAASTRTNFLKWAKIHSQNNNITDFETVAVHLDLKAEISELDQHIYGRTEKSWQGDVFWQRFKLALKAQKKKKEDGEDGKLKPLFRLQ